jgi:hypothetical protein
MNYGGYRIFNLIVLEKVIFKNQKKLFSSKLGQNNFIAVSTYVHVNSTQAMDILYLIKIIQCYTPTSKSYIIIYGMLTSEQNI